MNLKKENITSFEVIYTLSGDENNYSKWLYKKYGNLDNIKFIGLQSANEMLHLYNDSQCLIFPSRLETWGLPISEAKGFNMDIFLLNIEYAKETVGDYNKVQFLKINKN